MDYANLIIIAYEFTYTCLNCVNLSADDLLVLGSMQRLRLSTPLGTLCSLPQPYLRNGCPEVSALPTSDASPTLCIDILSSTRWRCPPTSAPTKNHRLVGRSKPRPYSAYFQHNTSQKTPFGRRVAPRCDRAGVGCRVVPWCDRVGVWM